MSDNNNGYRPDIDADGNGLTIRYSWLKNGGAVAALMLLAIAGCVLWAISDFYGCLLSGGGSSCYENSADRNILIGVSFVALVCLWRGLCGFFNSTTITVTRDGVRFRIGGLPWFGGGFVPAAKIQAITISERRATSRGGRGTPSYTVGLSRKFGSKTVYGEFHDDKAAADQLAKRIRKALGRD